MKCKKLLVYSKQVPAWHKQESLHCEAKADLHLQLAYLSRQLLGRARAQGSFTKSWLVGKFWLAGAAAPNQPHMFRPSLVASFLHSSGFLLPPRANFFAKNDTFLGPIFGPKNGTQNWALLRSLNRIPIELEKWGPKMSTILGPFFGIIFWIFFAFFFAFFFLLLGLLVQGCLLPVVGQGGWIWDSGCVMPHVCISSFLSF